MKILKQRIDSFVKLGEKLSGNFEYRITEEFENLLQNTREHNQWFTRENVIFSLRSISAMLKKDKLQQWISKYDFTETVKREPTNVLVIMAGNIPLVGFHDFLSVLVSGNNFIGKLSSDDAILLPALAEMLIEIEPAFKSQIKFIEGKAEGFDAVIATGSDNSSRYFEYYFGKYPNIIRRSRNSIAILNGKENNVELESLADDICLYFGLGCRSVSKLFVPDGFDIRSLFPAFRNYTNALTMHNKYMNNYDYNKSIFMMNQIPFIDSGFMLFEERTALSSPVAVLNYQYYRNIEEVKNYVQSEKEKIQCIVGNEPMIENIIPFGKSQQPELWDYADGVDTLRFLLS